MEFTSAGYVVSSWQIIKVPDFKQLQTKINVQERVIVKKVINNK
jgi:hypothetical protein